MFTIYDRPADFPHHVCVREFRMLEDGRQSVAAVAGLYDSIEAARDDLPPFLHRIPRQAGDLASVVETWL
jgi:hypothetical protein